MCFDNEDNLENQAHLFSFLFQIPATFQRVAGDGSAHAIRFCVDICADNGKITKNF